MSDPMFANADFTVPGYEIARITVTEVEEPEPEPVEVRVTYYNLAPEDGTVVSPLWVGFHNGTFDIYDVDSPAPERLERLAEDGDSAILSSDFIESGAGLVEGSIEGTAHFNAVLPGDSAMETFILDANDERSRYFSYGTIVVPSNDAFIANNNPEGIEIFDEDGNFIGADFIIERVYDAGTEVNDEVPENTAFLAQMVPNAGVDENGVVGLHPGFMPEGNILTAFPGADFTAPGYQVARITIERDIPNDPVNLTSVLTWDQVVPPQDAVAPVDTLAMGTAEMTLNEAGDALSYSITVSGLDFGGLIDGTPQTPSTDDDVTELHILNAFRGENGPVVFGVINPNDDDLSLALNPDGSTTISGIWEETDPADAPLSNFVDVLRENQPGDEVDLYLEIHTNEFAYGEIRGQFQISSAPPVNTPPVAFNDLARTDIDTPVAIDVLANDIDADLDPLTLSIATPPSNGTAIVNDQGTPDPGDDDISYQPNAGFQGMDQFIYRVDDGNGGTDTATVMVMVGPMPSRNRINGSEQDDVLIGTPDDDDIRGRAGNDALRGEEGK